MLYKSLLLARMWTQANKGTMYFFLFFLETQYKHIRKLKLTLYKLKHMYATSMSYKRLVSIF